MKRIMIPTDFSIQSEYAAKLAVKIAKKAKAEIYLVHLLDLPVPYTDFFIGNNSIPETIFFMNQAHEKFKSFKAKPFFKGVRVIETVQMNGTFKGIIEQSKVHKIDLIIMGSQGATGLKEMFIGSNTEKVVRKSPVPVLVVKQEVKQDKLSNFVFASDFNKECKKVFPKVLEFVRFFDAKLHLLRVNTLDDFITTENTKATINAFIKDFDMPDYTINFYSDSSIEKGILNFSRSINADIIALSTHGRKGIAHLFNGSIGEDLINHALRPVITFKL